MPNTFVDVTPERVSELVETMNNQHEERIVVLTKPLKIQTHAPTTKRKTHKIKIEVELSTDAFKGDGAIIDFGSIVMLHINKRHINPEFLKEETK